jgi:hypothetical protein
VFSFGALAPPRALCCNKKTCSSAPYGGIIGRKLTFAENKQQLANSARENHFPSMWIVIKIVRSKLKIDIEVKDRFLMLVES